MIRTFTRHPWWIVAAAALACYANTLPNEFCSDDVWAVALNPRVQEPGQGWAIWTTDYWSHRQEDLPRRDLLYRPVTVLSFRWVRQAFGSGPLAQHLVNVLLHAAVCVLLVGFVRNLGRPEGECLAAGLIFAVWPIHVEPVASVAGRADLLAALGFLMAAWCHHRSLMECPTLSKGGGPNTMGSAPHPKMGWGTPTSPLRISSYPWRMGAGLAAFLALAAKEVGVGVVAAIPVLDAYWTRPAGPRAVSTIRRSIYVLAPLAAYLLLRYIALEGAWISKPPVSRSVNPLVDAPGWQRVLGAVQLWGMYWAKTFWPAVLCVNYSVNALRLATTPFHPHVLWGGAVAVGLFFASLLAWRRRERFVAVGVLILLFFYFPVSNTLVLLKVFFAERIWYVPSLAAAVLIAWAVGPLLRHRAGGPVGIALLLVMAIRCGLRNSEWRNDGVLYAAAYRDQPDAVGVLHLYGQWFVEHGREADGIELLSRAVAIDLGYTDAHRALGRAFVRRGDFEPALRHLQIANTQAPGHPATEQALTHVREVLTARHAAALGALARQAALAPTDVGLELAVLRRLNELGRSAEALARLEGGEARFGHDPEWQAEYAATLVWLNRTDEAVERYRTVLRLNARDARRAAELAMLLLERRGPGDLEEAWQWAEQAAAVAPNNPAVLVCQAELLAVRGDLAGAVEKYKLAVESVPPDDPRRRVYAERLKALGG
jgi:tetratricopeptide (TPR) repeat protein